MAEDDAATVRAPVRVDFAGGWTDVHYFSEREGGAVLNAAINHYVEGRASWRDGRLRVGYELTAPPGSGLGSSAAINVAWLALTNRDGTHPKPCRVGRGCVSVGEAARGGGRQAGPLRVGARWVQLPYVWCGGRARRDRAARRFAGR
ncbi:MAG: hypothetical protein WKH64_13575 [Chloroflexia bacterium]